MLLVVLTKQILAVVVAIGCAHHSVDVLAVRRLRVRCKMAEADWLLMIKFNQNHRTVDAVVEDTIRFSAANPGKPGIVEMLANLAHFHTAVPVVHVPHVLGNQPDQFLFLRRRQAPKL